MDYMANMKRRRLLQASSALGLMGLVPGVMAQDGFNWKQAAGKKLEIHLIKNPRANCCNGIKRNLKN